MSSIRVIFSYDVHPSFLWWMWGIAPIGFNGKVMNNFDRTATTHFSIVNAATSTVKTALVVDDEAALLPVYTEFLERMGYVVASVTNGADAIDAMKEGSYNLVLLDLRMPAKTGFEVLNELRPAHPEACIIMVSGCVSDAFAATALRLGADSYVPKPCSLGYLADRIKQGEQLRTSLRGLGNRSKIAA